VHEVREADQQIQLALESSVLNAEHNKVLTKSIFLFELLLVSLIGFKNGFWKNAIETNGGLTIIIHILKSFRFSFLVAPKINGNIHY
jgi:hypothetical protein